MRRHAQELRAVTRVLGAVAVLAVGVDHLGEFALAYYEAIPTIGTLFALDFVAACVIAGGLVAPPALPQRRAIRLLRDGLALGGIGLAAGSLAGLLISEHTSLFGFMETGYRPAVVVSIVLDLTAILLLTAHVALPRPERSTIVDRT